MYHPARRTLGLAEGTSCGKCVQSCPTGALFQIGVTAGEMTRDPSRLNDIITARRKKEWNV